MNIIGLVTARGGSKRIENKNIIDLGGFPLIRHTIIPALNSKLIDEVFISTDDKKIADVAEKYGAKVPFIRPDDLALDNTPDKPVLEHFINWYEKKIKKSIDLLVFLRPTSPFRTPEIIDNVILKMQNSIDASSLRTVTKSEGVFHPYWNYKNINGYLENFCDIDISKYYQKQLLPDCFRLNGFIDILKPKIIIHNNNIYGDKIAYYEINENTAVDIDTEFDLLFARFIIDNKNL